MSSIFAWLTGLALWGNANLFPVAETAASPYPQDSIDDIAIWVDPADPARSLIIGTLKASNQRPVLPTGLLLYDLTGRQLQFLEGGTPNNVDLRDDVLFRGQMIPLLAVSHWYSGELEFFTVNQVTRRVERLSDTSLPTGMKKVQGICLYRSPDTQTLSAFVTTREGVLNQFRIDTDPAISIEKTGEYQFRSGTEGCAVDDENQALYVSEEITGLWRFDLTDGLSQSPVLIDRTGWRGHLTDDVEGITLLKTGAETGYIIVSAQGADEFVVYDRLSHAYVTTFDIEASGKVDGVTGTDGIDLTTRDLGAPFEEGMLVVQDNDNTDADGELINQSFKLVPLAPLLRILQKAEQDG
ncbi:MAG: phytase [Pseudomonadales bacterium]|nr:phytase [Pseudomonadales bacterium]